MAKFVCDIKQFKLRACPTFLVLKEMYFLIVISTIWQLSSSTRPSSAVVLYSPLTVVQNTEKAYIFPMT